MSCDVGADVVAGQAVGDRAEVEDFNAVIRVAGNNVSRAARDASNRVEAGVIERDTIGRVAEGAGAGGL